MITVLTYDSEYKNGVIPSEITQTRRRLDGDFARSFTKVYYAIYTGMKLRFEFYVGDGDPNVDYVSIDNHTHFATYFVECGEDGVLRKWWERL